LYCGNDLIVVVNPDTLLTDEQYAAVEEKESHAEETSDDSNTNNGGSNAIHYNRNLPCMSSEKKDFRIFCHLFRRKTEFLFHIINRINVITNLYRHSFRPANHWHAESLGNFPNFASR